MKRGILIYAHNNRSIDYAVMAIISGGLAKKNLNGPVSLITDPSTVEWMSESKILEKATTIFENIIIVTRPETNNQRRLSDGECSNMVPFVNTNRDSVWDLTPYDRTLLIDSDFFILSDRLNNYWGVEDDLLLGESINDIYDNARLGYLDKYVSEVGVKLYWATTVMFTKNENTKLFFDTVNFIKENYKHYADVFRFDARQYRNDIAFSIAKHILDGYQESITGRLPAVLTTLDKDILYDLTGNKLNFLVNHRLDNNFCAASISNLDIHIMNKQSIIRNKDKLMEML